MTTQEIIKVKEVLDTEYARLQNKITECRENGTDDTRYNTAQGALINIYNNLEDALGINFFDFD